MLTAFRFGITASYYVRTQDEDDPQVLAGNFTGRANKVRLFGVYNDGDKINLIIHRYEVERMAVMMGLIEEESQTPPETPTDLETHKLPQ